MKYLRRFVWFVASRLLVVFVVLGLAVTTFYYAMNLTNIQVILKDGMARRAQTVMGIETLSEAELNKYFQPAFLEQDAAVIAVQQGTSPYADYAIRGIDHRLDMGFTWLWPWDTVCRVEITERIPSIDGRIKGGKAEEAVARRGESAIYPPHWQSARYRAVLVKENNQWRVKSLTLLENLP